MTRIGTVEDTDSVCIARAVISHGASSGDPVTCKCTLNNVDHQCDLPKDGSKGSKLFINAIKNGGAPNSKRLKPEDVKTEEIESSGKSPAESKPTDENQDDVKPSGKGKDDKKSSKDKKKRKKIRVETVDSEDDDSSEEESSDDDSSSVRSVKSDGSESTASKDTRPVREICKETMKQLATQRTSYKKKVQKKVKKDWKRAGIKKLSEDQLVKGFTNTINSSRTEPMWQVVMDMVFLWCKKHKKLISNETVSKLKKKVSGIEQFEKQPIKIFTKEAGWLRKEPDFWI